jgi:hypothetical protein
MIGWTVGTGYVYRCIYCASHEGVTLTREEEHLGRWSRPYREREIDTKILISSAILGTEIS